MSIDDIMGFVPIGGVAKRMQPLTVNTSKACIRLMNKPLVEYSLINMAKQGIRNLIFGVKRGQNYRDVFEHYQEGLDFSTRYGIAPRVHMKYQPNIEDLGSGDSLRINLEYYDVKRDVLVVQGDNICLVDLRDLAEQHKEKGALITIALTEVEKTEEYGIAEMDDDFKIKRFVEKPKKGENQRNLANAGIYLFSKEIIDVLNSDDLKKLTKERKRLDFGMDLIPFLIEKGHEVYGYTKLNNWYDVGNPEGI